jgi:hypothetical protein
MPAHRFIDTFLCAALLLIAPAAHALVYVMPTDAAMVDRSPVIVFGEVVATEPGPAGGPLATDVMFQVEEVLKGFVPGGTIVIRQPGGVGPDGLVGRVVGLPALAEGDRVLLFLNPVEGVYRTVELALGMFFEAPAGGRMLLQREPALRLAEVAGGPTTGASGEEWRPRDAVKFRRWIADHAAGADRPADYFTNGPLDEPVAAVSAFNLSTADACARPELPVRWLQFDRGESVEMVVQADGQRGVVGGGMSQVLAAMEAWNQDPRSRVNLVQGGLTKEQPNLESDGTNSITFEDPHDEIDGSYDPATGGTLAIAWWYYWCREHDIPGRPRAQSYELAEANITTQDGYYRWVSSQDNPRRAHAQIMAHELGHAVGLGHSCGDDESGPCESDQVKHTIMRALIGGDPIEGAALKRDDRNGVRRLYPLTGPAGPVGPAAPSDLTITDIKQTELTLRWQDRSGDETGFEIHERMVDSEFMRIATLPANTTSVVIEDIPPATFRAYQVIATNNRGSSNPTLEVGATTLAPVVECMEDGDTVCLSQGRFRVELQWESADGAGRGAAVPLTNDTGYLWFFQEDNVEVVVKVLDGGCHINQRYWVFAGGLTDVEVVMKVIDSETGVAATYYNPPGTAFQPVQDQETFAVCPQGGNLYGESRYLLAEDEMEALRGGAARAAVAVPAGPGSERRFPFQAAQAQDGGGNCEPDEQTLCLEGGRYAVRATWEKPNGETGDAVVFPLALEDTGLYWFFDSRNIEMVLKVLDGCDLNGHRWVFAGGLTDVGVKMIVTDTETGEEQRYGNPPGAAFQPIQDLNAFSCSAP